MSCRFSHESLPFESTPVDNVFLMEYMPHANHDQLRVYLYGLMICRYPGLREQSIATELALSEQEVLDAFAYWQKEGLVRIFSADPLEVEYITPSRRVAPPVLVPGKYGSLVQSVQSLFAPRQLKQTELRHLYDWVEIYHMDPGAVMELVSYCLTRKGPSVSFQYINVVARSWADAGVITMEDARAQALAYEEMTGGAAAILMRWRKSRRPTQDELTLYKKWTNTWGFTLDAILAACPALTNAERPSFAYLDGVLDRLQRKGVISASQVEEQLRGEQDNATLALQLFSCMGIGRSARPNEREEMQSLINEGFSLDVLIVAAEQAREKERPLPHFKRLVEQLRLVGALTDKQQAQSALQNSSASTGKSGKKSHLMDYPQTHYSEEQLAHIFIPLNEEGAGQ
ncbi:DnaD domain protein [Eubacteriales bacterium OttesenSCG-928-K08]|nr:DnaD domain protein [Eubacteriales bacterium OttesenSCG-928-K08]